MLLLDERDKGLHGRKEWLERRMWSVAISMCR